MDDRLQQLIDAQASVNQRVGMSHEDLSDEDLTVWIGRFLAAMTNECEELRSHTHWKWWKNYDGLPIDRNQIKIEIVDMLHFLLSLALPVMTADELFDVYMAKNRLNHARQDAGYNKDYEKVDASGREDNDKIFDHKEDGNEPD